VREIVAKDEIGHYNIHKKQKQKSKEFLPNKNVVKIILTSGASCPDTLVDSVMMKILEFYSPSKKMEDVLAGIGAN
jgi:4-hydroxy-3-methylbut-2-enyl diphosphate reductase